MSPQETVPLQSDSTRACLDGIYDFEATERVHVRGCILLADGGWCVIQKHRRVTALSNTRLIKKLVEVGSLRDLLHGGARERLQAGAAEASRKRRKMRTWKSHNCTCTGRRREAIDLKGTKQRSKRDEKERGGEGDDDEKDKVQNVRSNLNTIELVVTEGQKEK